MRNQCWINAADFNENETLKTIRDLNIHKAQVHNDIYIKMIKNLWQTTNKTINSLAL